MILLMSALTGLAVLLAAILVACGIAAVVPRIVELVSSRDGFAGGFLFPVWQIAVVGLLIFSGGAYWGFRRARRKRPYL
jgi:hypothetical protein